VHDVDFRAENGIVSKTHNDTESTGVLQSFGENSDPPN
jgi:hypothetical protein